VVDMEGETKACWDHDDDSCGRGSEDAEAGTSGAGRDGGCCGE
jgi:hypothetical protein